MNFSLSAEHKLIQQTVRDFLKKDCPIEKVREYDELDEYPLDVFNKMKKIGLSSLTISKKYGGTGRDLLGAVIVMEELSKRFPVLNCMYAMSTFYGGLIIEENGSEKQKKKFLPKVADGDLLFSYASGDTGEDSGSTFVQASPSQYDGRFVLNGKIAHVPGADRVDYILIPARLYDDNSQNDRITMFIIDPKMKGIEINLSEKLGLKGLNFCEIDFKNMELHIHDILGEEKGINQGQQQNDWISSYENLEIAACSVGIAEGAFDEAKNYARIRKQFGKPINRFQVIRHMLVDMATEIQAARLLLYHTVWAFEKNYSCSLESLMSKYYTSNIAQKVSIQCMQIFGGYGYMMEYDSQRFVRDSLSHRMRKGTPQDIKNMIAKELNIG